MPRYTDKTVSIRRDQFLKSWKEFALETTFAGMTVAEFEERSNEPIEARERIAEARTKVSGLLLDREKADQTLNDDLILIAHAIRGNKSFGEDCALYRSLGFVPKSERKSGMTRKPKAKAADTSPAQPAANAA